MSVEIRYVNCESETSEIAKIIADEIRGGGLVALDGDLGAGKTFFTGALCEKLGIERKFVSSPTFVIMKKYSGKINVYHWDFYRIGSVDELYATDFHEYLSENNSLMIIEWASMFKKCWSMKTPRIEVRIDFGEKDDERRIQIERIF